MTTCSRAMWFRPSAPRSRRPKSRRRPGTRTCASRPCCSRSCTSRPSRAPFISGPGAASRSRSRATSSAWSSSRRATTATSRTASFKTSRVFQFVLAFARAERRPEGRHLVGEPPPLAPQALGHAARRPLGAAARVLVLAHRLGAAQRVERHRRGARQGSLALPGAALPQPAPASRSSRWRCSAWPSSSSAASPASCGASSSPRSCCGTARSRSTRSRTSSGRRRYATTDDSRNNWALAHRHDGRGLAQQPPPLPELGAAGLSLVGGRRHLLRAVAAGARRARVGSAPPAARRSCRLAVRPRPPTSRCAGRLRARVWHTRRGVIHRSPTTIFPAPRAPHLHAGVAGPDACS